MHREYIALCMYNVYYLFLVKHIITTAIIFYRYYENKVFVSLANGDIVVYVRDNGK